MRDVVLFGNGQIAEIAKFYFDHDSEFRVRAVTVDAEFIKEDLFDGLPVVPFENVEQLFPPSENLFFVALSYSKLNKLRKDRYLKAKAKGYDCASYISSKAAFWPGLNVGENAFILENVTLQPFVKIGNNVTIWSGTHVGHHSTIGDHTFVASQIVISGGVEIGECCFLGVNATLRDHIKIGDNTVLGAGTLLLSDAQPDGLYKGVESDRSAVPSSRIRSL